jgi:flagellar hook-associated protein 3 FlgL
MVEAINLAHQQDPAAMPFTAAVDPLDDRFGGAGTILTATTPPVTTHDGGGSDFDQAHGFQIVSGTLAKTIDLAAAVTIEDLVNTLNTSGLGILAEINRTSTGIDVRTRLSGGDFAIGEHGGTAAAQLGIRTFDRSTLLADLNFGRGVAGASAETSGGSLDQADFAITRNDGVTFEVDIHGAKSIGDVIDLINGNAINQDPQQGVPLVARLAAFGNGIELVDNSTGTSRLTVTRLNGSTAAVDLGLVPAGQDSRSSPTTGAMPDLLTGADVNPREAVGLFTALLRLQHGLLNNDSWEIERAMAMLDQTTTNMNFARAELGARQQGLDLLQTRWEDEDTQIREDLSRDYDVDLTQVISDLTAKQVAMQASLQSIAQTARMTLLDYL